MLMSVAKLYGDERGFSGRQSFPIFVPIVSRFVSPIISRENSVKLYLASSL